MANQLNIKSEDGYRLATELSVLTGESLTAAVTEALREKLQRETHARDRSAKLARLTALASDIRAALRPHASLSQASLYDGSGRPK